MTYLRAIETVVDVYSESQLATGLVGKIIADALNAHGIPAQVTHKVNQIPVDGEIPSLMEQLRQRNPSFFTNSVSVFAGKSGYPDTLPDSDWIADRVAEDSLEAQRVAGQPAYGHEGKKIFEYLDVPCLVATCISEQYAAMLADAINTVNGKKES